MSNWLTSSTTCLPRLKVDMGGGGNFISIGFFPIKVFSEKTKKGFLQGFVVENA
jgi:hypothetical protein